MENKNGPIFEPYAVGHCCYADNGNMVGSYCSDNKLEHSDRQGVRWFCGRFDVNLTSATPGKLLETEFGSACLLSRDLSPAS